MKILSKIAEPKTEKIYIVKGIKAKTKGVFFVKSGGTFCPLAPNFKEYVK